MTEGFRNPLVLSDSHKRDSVLCVELADVDWDGQKEILLGTFGKVYTYLIMFTVCQTIMLSSCRTY